MGAQLGHLPNSLLLGLLVNQVAVTAQPISERHCATQVAPASLLIGLHLPDAFSDAIALSLRKGSGDRQEQLGYAVAGDVAAEIDQMELDAATLQALDDLQRIEG